MYFKGKYQKICAFRGCFRDVKKIACANKLGVQVIFHIADGKIIKIFVNIF